MGLKASVVNATFDAIIPGLAAHKYDLGMSSFTDTKEREETVDFVTYFSAGTSFFVKADGGPAIDDARRPLRQEGRRREGHDAGRRRHRAEQEVQRRRQAEGDRARSSPTRTARTSRCRAGAPRSAWPTRRVAAYQVKQSDGEFKLVRRALRHGAIRHRDPEGHRHGRAPCWRRSRRSWPTAATRRSSTKWGVSDGRDRRPRDQRGDRLAEGSRPAPHRDERHPDSSRAPRDDQGCPGAAPGTLARRGDRPDRRGSARLLGRDEPALRLGRRRRVPLQRPRSCTGCC